MIDLDVELGLDKVLQAFDGSHEKRTVSVHDLQMEMISTVMLQQFITARHAFIVIHAL